MVSEERDLVKLSSSSHLMAMQRQRVVVDGFTSQEAPVLSGVPQGTVLGPLLFLVFINDIVADISSPIRLFADACLFVPRGQVSV